jgi:alcohol dehydrogenase
MLSYLTDESYIHVQNNLEFHIKIKDNNMRSFQFQTVPHIISGIGRIQQLKEVLQDFSIQRILLVTDTTLVQSGIHEPILQQLEDGHFHTTIFQDVEADPKEQQILEAIAYAQDHHIEAVIGFGGGSVMDVAKLIALLAHPQQTQQLTDIYGVHQAKKPRLPLVLIPTTAGTGAEVTPISIVTTSDTQKTGVVSAVLFADVTILDASFCLGLPQHITAATGIDAMVHAIEAYTSKLKKNPYSDLLAKSALKLLNQNLPKVLKDGQDIEARQAMLEGAMLAGQAFANAPVAAVHALAYPLGGHFHLSHGHANAIVLTEVLKFNTPTTKQLYAELMTWLDPKSKGCFDGLTDLFIDHFDNHLQRSGLILKLKELNIPEDALNRLADDAILQTRLLQNNPRPLQHKDALQIYQAIYQ